MNLTRNGLIILISIIAVVFVGGMFTVAYAGPILPMITLAGDVTITGDMTCPGCVDSGDLGFGAVNVLNINNDAVRAVHILDGQVGSAEIDTGAVGTSEIADGSISSADLAFDTANQAELDAHAANTVAHHPIPSVYTVTETIDSISPGTFALVSVSCAPGDLATGGGQFPSVNAASGSNPHGTNSWRAFMLNNDVTPGSMIVYVVCLDITP